MPLRASAAKSILVCLLGRHQHGWEEEQSGTHVSCCLIPMKVVQILSLGPLTWKDVRRNALSGSANWETNSTEQLYKVSTPCNDQQFKKEELETLGELTTGCFQIVLKWL